MKRKVFKRYRVRKRGGQHYWVGRRLQINYGIKFMNKRDINRLIRQREKEGIIVLPTYEGFIFHDPETRERKVIFEAKKKNYGMAWSGKTDTPLIDYPKSYGYKKRVKMMSPETFIELTRKEAMGRVLRNKGRTSDSSYIFDPKSYEEVVISKSRVEELKPALASKEPLMSEPWIELEKGFIVGHEGRNRAIAARELGIKKIPVHFVYKENEPIPE